MQRIDTPDGLFVDGDPFNDILGTLVTAAWLNSIQQEVAGVIEGLGFTLDSSKTNQLLTAIETLIEARAGEYLIDTGTVNAYVVALNPAVSSYPTGQTVKFRAVHANTGACTLNAGAGAVPLVRDDGTALQSGDIAPASIVTATYDAPTNSFLVNSIVLSQLGALARLGIGAGLQNVSGNLALKLLGPLATDANGNLTLGIGSGLQNSAGSLALKLASAGPLSIDGSGELAFGAGNGFQVTNGNLGLQLADSSLRVGASGVQSSEPVANLSGTVAVTASSNTEKFVGTGTLNLAATAGLWNGFRFSAFANGGTITLTPNAADKFVGGSAGASFTLPVATSAEFVCDGAGNWVLLYQTSTAASSSGAQYINAATILTKGEYLVDTANSRFTCLLPASPTLGQSLTFEDVNGSWGRNPWVLGNNGSTIMGYNASLTINVADQKFTIWFNGTTWRLV
ncbi:hypothetical protein [Paraburkholderia unamae]|uniref:Tail fiber protein n=1 Tax=Paraburkholderia unamae TaxID=219649 RepID=A0ABX5KHX6_9BURK|nr:hypothetical protein [Paraburkholderia unamae]PVX80064.1 hypothetical protein C7402_112251 [Paraburkholderia unamae]